MDPVFKEYESPYAVFGGNPILATDVLGDDSNDPTDDTHKIEKGETLTSISKKYAVSVEDLVKMNDIKDPDKIKAGETIFINPERNFINAPYADPANNNGLFEEYTEVKNLANITDIGLDWANGKGSENTVYTGGNGFNMVKTMPPVRELITKGVTQLFADGKLIPGEVFISSYDIGKIYGPNGRRILKEQFKKFFGNENDNMGYSGAESVIGSFSFSMRVLADGYTIRIAVYNSTTIRSGTDGLSNATIRRSPIYRGPLSAQFQRFVWEMVLCSPGLNQKK